MEQIILNNENFQLLEKKYPDLTYNESDNTISGVLSFYRSYNGKTLKGKYSVEFKLEDSNDGSTANLVED